MISHQKFKVYLKNYIAKVISRDCFNEFRDLNCLMIKISIKFTCLSMQKILTFLNLVGVKSIVFSVRLHTSDNVLSFVKKHNLDPLL